MGRVELIWFNLNTVRTNLANKNVDKVISYPLQIGAKKTSEIQLINVTQVF